MSSTDPSFNRINKYPDDFFRVDYNQFDSQKRRKNNSLNFNVKQGFRMKKRFFFPLLFTFLFIFVPLTISHQFQSTYSKNIYFEYPEFSGSINSTDSHIIRIKAINGHTSINFNFSVNNRVNKISSITQNRYFEYFFDGKINFSLTILQVTPNSSNQSINNKEVGLKLEILKSSFPTFINRLPDIINLPNTIYYPLFNFLLINFSWIYLVVLIFYERKFGKENGYEIKDLKKLFGENAIWFNKIDNPPPMTNYKEFLTFMDNFSDFFRLYLPILTVLFFISRITMINSNYYIYNQFLQNTAQFILYLVIELLIYYFFATNVFDLKYSLIPEDFVDSFILTPEGIYLFFVNNNEYTLIQKNENIIFQVITYKEFFGYYFIIESENFYFTFLIKHQNSKFLKSTFFKKERLSKSPLTFYNLIYLQNSPEISED